MERASEKPRGFISLKDINDNLDTSLQEKDSYNSWLITYMKAINEDYEKTINDTELQNIKQKIIEVVKKDNERIL